MTIKLLGQGYEANSKDSIGNYLIKFLNNGNYHAFTCFTAFTSQAAINGLSKHILSAKEHLKLITFVTGVDQKGTSKEALEALLELKINAYVFYLPSFSIFHPKIYLFEGEKSSELIIGSSNLTAQGLFTNVESSILISIDNKIDKDKEIVKQLKKYFSGIFNLNDPNLKRLTKKLIKNLVEANVVPNELERKIAQDKTDKDQRKKTERIINSIFPKRECAKFPKEFRSIIERKSKNKTLVPASAEATTPKGKLVWTSRRLPASSVQVGGKGTNPTGGLRLVQDDFKVNGEKISQTTYFRNDIFGGYKWEEIRRSPYVEAATIPFEITISNEPYGNFDLEVRHKPSGEAGQGNYTTSISWGTLGEVIKDANLTGKRLDLYAPKGRGKSKSFYIIIS